MVVLARLAVLMSVLTSVAACSLARPVVERWAPSPLRYVLDNGVRLVIEARTGSDEAALQLWVAAGGRDESAPELGLAHYLEHSLFKGTASRPLGFVEREVEAAGGRMNAGTSFDYTYFHIVLPAGRVIAAIEALADISINAALDPVQLEREKRVVLEEMRLGQDNPNRLLMQKLYEAVFDGHPYGRPVIGTPEVVRALTREQLLAFYRQRYGPEAFTLVVVGGVDPHEVVAAATRVFRRLPRAHVGRLPAPVPPAVSTRTISITRPGSHGYLAVGWPAPRTDHADAPALDLLASVLGQGRAARLTQSLRERLGLVSAVTAGYAPLQAAGIVSIAVQAEPQNLARVEAEILREVQRLSEEGVTEAELERVLTTAEAQRELQFETAEGRATVLGHAETVWRIDEALAYLDRLRSVTREQIRAAARRYLDPAHYARVSLAPGGAR
jgi:zinc protease